MPYHHLSNKPCYRINLWHIGFSLLSWLLAAVIAIQVYHAYHAYQ